MPQKRIFEDCCRHLRLCLGGSSNRGLRGALEAEIIKYNQVLLRLQRRGKPSKAATFEARTAALEATSFGPHHRA